MPRARIPEVDLHGYTVAQAMDAFTRAYNSARAGGRETRLIVIHGWNAGELRGSIAATLHKLLNREGLKFEHPFEGNIGRTAVRLGAALPDRTERAPIKVKPERPRGDSKRKLSGGL